MSPRDPAGVLYRARKSNRRVVAYTWMTAALLACDADTRPLGPGRDLPQPAFQTITQPTITVTLTPTSSDQGLPRDSVGAYKDLTPDN